MDATDHNAVLLLGCNLGNCYLQFCEAKKKIVQRAGYISAESSFYKSGAWGRSEQPDFLNQALIIQCKLNPEDLLATTKIIERELGREHHEKWAPRTMDIDILFFGSEIIGSSNLAIPHPMICLRKFTLVPLAELIPDYFHPVENLSIKELLKRCPDKGKVEKVEFSKI